MRTPSTCVLLLLAAAAATARAADDQVTPTGMLGEPQHEERSTGDAGVLTTTTGGTSGAFSVEEQALWLDRHNYFRMTALPFAAANMLRMRWSAELATQAAAETAAACGAPTSGAGKNAAVVAPQDQQSVVDAAFQQWVVEPALKAFTSLKAPKPGDAVGAGVYNTYAQVVWSSTNQVGCARASCDGGKLAVVCKYAPAGNDGKSPWYVHGPTGSACPEGTVSKVGLCGPAEDAATKELAPIPVGANAYDVFKDFIPKMQAILQGAQAPDADKSAPPTTAPPAKDSATPSPASKAPEDSKRPAVNAGSAAGGDGNNGPPANGGDTGVVPSTTPPSSASPGKKWVRVKRKKSDGMADSSDASSAGDVAAASSAPSSPPSSSTPNESDPPTSAAPGKTYIRVKRSKAPSSDAPSSDFDPGKVRPGSASGDFVNALKTTEPTPKPTDAPASGAGQQSKSASTPAGELSKGETAANTKGAQVSTGSSGFSAAGIAGTIVVGCVLIAGIAVFVSYRKNQQRQRDILQNGGIHVL
ncbi:hypothetical protein P43SY_006508 [Pythium insidiosum]|uniref:SCP domain-containing protein n=1 Tax=Pythium insidiosum TaxID=114742 RepID=A0AAD5M2G8_PYTIN|nr:hypothetical protein P43SY_006508 [Pythium insidiosum]